MFLASCALRLNSPGQVPGAGGSVILLLQTLDYLASCGFLRLAPPGVTGAQPGRSRVSPGEIKKPVAIKGGCHGRVEGLIMLVYL